jgi:hypothetical protein
MSQHTIETVTPILHRRSVIDDTPVEMYNANHGNVRPPRGERSFQCVTCLREFPKSQIMVVDGKPYCRPYRHYIDALKEKEK